MVGNEKVVPAHAMKEYGKVNIRRQTFLTSALNGDEWPTLRSVRFTPLSQKNPPYALNRRFLLSSRVCLDALNKR